MADYQRGAEVLDMRRAGRQSLQEITESDVDFEKYAFRSEHAKVIPAESLAEEGKRRMLLGRDAAIGLTLPWPKAEGRVRMAPGKVIVWAGWQHHGKSAATQQTMLHAITEGERVCIASMEEDKYDVWDAMGYMACGGKEPTPREINRWVEFQTQHLWFYDQQGTVGADKLLAVIRYCAEEVKITQFVIDSLMMLEVDRDDYSAQSRFMGRLKALAKDTGTTIHLVAHMRKRDGGSGEDRPGDVHDIAGGHEIGSKADTVFIVWRNKKEQEKRQPNDRDCVLLVKKQRGRVNWLGSFGLDYHLSSRQFIEGKFPMSFWPAVQREPGSDDEENHVDF